MSSLRKAARVVRSVARAAVAAATAPATPTAQEGHRIIQVVPPDKAALDAIARNNYLTTYGYDVTSQGGEDGVNRKVLETIGLTKPGWCVEFGACDGKRDSNTWDLVKNHGWKAVYIEAESSFFPLLEQHCKETPGTWCFSDYVSWEGESRLDAILARTPIPLEFEFLAMDVDGPDYYIWEAFEKYHPHVVCIEFHRLIHPSVFAIPPKDAAASRPSSLRAMVELGKRKGYELVCVVNWNAVFVRKEHFPKFNIKDNRPESMFYADEEMRLFQGYDGTLFIAGPQRHYWKYQRTEDGIIRHVTITHNDIQVLPEGVRSWRPRHTYECKTMQEQAGKLDAAKVPGNVLLKYRHNVHSECGEDGILEHIFEKIGTTRRFCVEVGARDGVRFSKTRNLIANKGWKGLLVETEKEAFAKLSELYRDSMQANCVGQLSRHGPTLEDLLRQHQVPHDFDLLSIDIEGNDYHLFAAHKDFIPSVVVIGFNPSVPNDIRFIQEDSNGGHYGVSLRALVELAKHRHYELAAVTDWNAIFVRRDLFGKLDVKDNAIESMYVPPFEMHMFFTLDGCTFLQGCRTLFRQDYEIEWEDFQVIPRQLRTRDNTAKVFGTFPTFFYK